MTLRLHGTSAGARRGQTIGALFLLVAVCAYSQQPAAREEEVRELREHAATLDTLLRQLTDLEAETEADIESLEKEQGEARHLDLSSVAICLDYMWLLICGAQVMLMQAGFAMLEAGSVTSKNSGLVLLKNLVDGCNGALCWYFHINDSIIGITHFKDWFFQWAFCATAATIVSGAVAERMAFPAYVLYSVMMTGVIYPVVLYWTRDGSGWLSIGSGASGAPDGYSDFAGSGIVHLTGGIGALVGAILLGPRAGRWTQPDDFKPCNTSMVVIGTLILWFGWYGFNCGSTLAFSDVGTATQAGLVAMNTTLSAAAGGVTLLTLRLRTKTYDMCGMCNGILAGLVAVCASVGHIEPSYALLTGMLGAIACEMGHVLVHSFKIDDPLDAFAVHGCGGTIGLLLRPLFDRTGVKGKMFRWQCIGILAIAGWTAVCSLAVMLPLKVPGFLRLQKEEEQEGAQPSTTSIRLPP